MYAFDLHCLFLISCQNDLMSLPSHKNLTSCKSVSLSVIDSQVVSLHHLHSLAVLCCVQMGLHKF